MRFHASVTRAHSPFTLSRPCRLKWQNPIAGFDVAEHRLRRLLAQYPRDSGHPGSPLARCRPNTASIGLGRTSAAMWPPRPPLLCRRLLLAADDASPGPWRPRLLPVLVPRSVLPGSVLRCPGISICWFWLCPICPSLLLVAHLRWFDQALPLGVLARSLMAGQARVIHRILAISVSAYPT